MASTPKTRSISLRPHVGNFEKVPQYKARFEAFDYHTARMLFEVDAWDQLYDNKMIPSKQADIDVKKAARLYSELQETEDEAQAKRFDPMFVWSECEGRGVPWTQIWRARKNKL